jgi:hypothetical protein
MGPPAPLLDQGRVAGLMAIETLGLGEGALPDRCRPRRQRLP